MPFDVNAVFYEEDMCVHVFIPFSARLSPEVTPSATVPYAFSLFLFDSFHVEVGDHLKSHLTSEEYIR
jgi:hypothetical protein